MSSHKSFSTSKKWQTAKRHEIGFKWMSRRGNLKETEQNENKLENDFWSYVEKVCAVAERRFQRCWKSNDTGNVVCCQLQCWIAAVTQMAKYYKIIKNSSAPKKAAHNPISTHRFSMILLIYFLGNCHIHATATLHFLAWIKNAGCIPHSLLWLCTSNPTNSFKGNAATEQYPASDYAATLTHTRENSLVVYTCHF